MGSSSILGSFAAHGCNLRNPSLLDSRGLVAGHWVSAPGEKDFPVYEPSSNQMLHNCSNFGKDAFVAAINAADDGYKRFNADTTAQERGVMLRKWNDPILENQQDCRSDLFLFLLTGNHQAQEANHTLQWPKFLAWRMGRLY